jgi:hypothetical protein
MFDATSQPVYKEWVEKWFRLRKVQMKAAADSTYQIWHGRLATPWYLALQARP